MPIEPSELDSVTELADLERRLQGCERCRLAKSRTNLVFGVGNPQAKLVFVGEAPGANEDREGYPFVGAAGKLLDEMLITVLSLTRKEVYICNVNKCRPPNNRDPLPEEVAACRPYLLKQLALIKPLIICTLGNFATRAVLEQEVYISRVHGQVVAHQDYKVFPSYHPAAALYARATKDTLVADFQTLAGLLVKETALRSDDNTRDSSQLGLF